MNLKFTEFSKWNFLGIPMKKAALYVEGHIVTADSHLAAYQKLTIEEQNSNIVSGFFNPDTEEFDSDKYTDHFFNKKILLIRHAEVENQQQSDPPLSDFGQKQAESLANLIKKHHSPNLQGFTSPFLRCLQTCAIISEITKIKFVVKPEIMESVEPQTIPNRQKEYPQFEWQDSNDVVAKKENSKEFALRVKKSLKQLPNESILITHFGVIYNMVLLALCADKAKKIIQNGIPPISITSINKQELKCLCDKK